MSHAYKMLLVGAASGLGYGLLVRGVAHLMPRYESVFVMSLAFVFLLPLAMGFVSVFLTERHHNIPVGMWFLWPWLPVAAALVCTFFLLWEGLICIAMFAPVGLGLGSIGGVIGGVAARRLRRSKSANSAISAVLLLPLLLAPWESRFLKTQELRTVETSIDIAAPPDIIWHNIERVPAIHPSEIPVSWTQRIGFPRPVEATLSFEGVGGIRHATFERGVLFIENVDVWEPQHRLAFSIHAQTEQIPPTTLDHHVTVGGPFFDVLRGEYRLEPLPNSRVRLHLLSQHRLSTDFNWYSRLWTDALMADIQRNILRVIERRCREQALMH